MCNKMSDVRLSNASPTVERVDARQPENVRPPVRRNLFGTPDREEVQRYLAAAIEDDVQAFVERYDFDPVEERPLPPVNYQWQEDRDAPEFYRRPPHGSQQPQRDPSEGDEGQSGRHQNGASSRKRRAGPSAGPCSGEGSSKRSHADEDDEDDPSGGAGSPAVEAAEDRPRQPENREEVQ